MMTRGRYCYMTFHLGSLYLTLTGMTGVALSFPLTWAVNVLFFRIPFMGMFNVSHGPSTTLPRPFHDLARPSKAFRALH